MPIIKSAIKKVRKDKKRTMQNARYINAYKDAMKKVKRGGGNLNALLSKAYSAVDKAIKKHVIQKNKGQRLKSRISKLVKKPEHKQPVKHKTAS